MAKQPIKAFVFDVYGTLFDVHSVIEKCEEFFPEKGEDISITWRTKQLQYANLRQIMGNYQPFSTVTKDALHFAVKKHGKELDEETENTLLKEYERLRIYPEVKEVLEQLSDRKLAVYSNGSHDMLDPLINDSEISNLIDEILSADEVKQYKPAPAAYEHAVKVLDVKPEEVLFMSSNGWDISGAKNFGFQAARIDRKNLPEEELNLLPNNTYNDLTGILEWK